MNEIQVFNSPDFGDIRTLTIEGEPWFVGKDVAVALGYANASKAVSAHVDDEDKKIEVMPYSQNGNTVGKLTIINESGLYCLILSSKLPAAKKFKRWVTSEVLPDLRRNGSYTVLDGGVALSAEYMRAASIIASCRDGRLPMVLRALGKAGLDTDALMQAQTPGAGHIQAECDREHLMAVLSRYGVREAAALTGLQPAVISRYRRGVSRPNPERYQMLVEVLG